MIKVEEVLARWELGEGGELGERREGYASPPWYQLKPRQPKGLDS